MKPTSRKHLAAASQALNAALEPLIKGRHGAERATELASEFFVFSDALASSAQLRQLLADPTGSAEVKQATLDKLLGTKANPIIIETLKALTAQPWGSDDDYQEAVEELGQEALLHAAAKDGELEHIEAQLFHLGHQLHRQPDAVAGLADPGTTANNREGVLRTLLEHKPHAITTILTQRAAVGAGNYLEKLLKLGNKLAAQRRLTVANVTSAVVLSEEQTERIARILTEKYGKAVEVVTTVDPAIIGGLRIEIGPYVIDDTIRARLADVERKLA